ncbi:MAG: threonine ammonia-lyase [Alphaproteobacteria bacterium]
MDAAPTLAQIEAARARLGDLVIETPVTPWRGEIVERVFGAGTELLLKLELFQVTGTFKPRGALCVMLSLDPQELARGVTAVSAGNHAIAVAYAARVLETTAKVVMMQGASPFRVEQCRSYGAEVVFAEDVHKAFAMVEEIKEREGRSFVHPFEGPQTVLGTATVGWEFCRQAPELDAVIVPIGGGGLCAGISRAVKLAQPSCEVFGIEPEGADSMHRSFAAGEPVGIDAVRTIADSLGAPYATPGSFALCRDNVDELVLISDDEMRAAMKLLFHHMKLGVEPAGAASTAALAGPLRERLAGKRVGLIICGTNTDLETFRRHTA